MLLADEALDGGVAWAGTHMLLPYKQKFLDASRAARTICGRATMNFWV